MKKTLTFLMLFVVVFGHAQNTKAIIDQAEADSRNGNPAKALASLDKAVAENPSVYALYHVRGKTYGELERFQEAIDDFAKALQLDPKAAEVYNSRGLMLNTLGYYDEALVDSQNAIEYAADPHQKNVAITVRADAKRLKKDNAGAIEDYLAVLAAKPEPGIEINSLLNIAKSYAALQKNDEAIAHLERLTRNYPKLSIGFTNLAFRYSAIGNYKKAIELNEQVIAIEQNTIKDKNGVAEMGSKVLVKDGSLAIALAYNNKGYAELQLGNADAALASINHSIKLYPENSYAFRNRAFVYLAQKSNSAACIDIRKSLELGFTATYGDEVEKLRKLHCDN